MAARKAVEAAEAAEAGATVRVLVTADLLGMEGITPTFGPLEGQVLRNGTLLDWPVAEAWRLAAVGAGLTEVGEDVRTHRDRLAVLRERGARLQALPGQTGWWEDEEWLAHDLDGPVRV